MIPQMTVVADLTRSEVYPSLKPGSAVGDSCRLSSVHEAQRQAQAMLNRSHLAFLQHIMGHRSLRHERLTSENNSQIEIP